MAISPNAPTSTGWPRRCVARAPSGTGPDAGCGSTATMVEPVPRARLAGRARGALPLRPRAGDPRLAAPVGRDRLGRQDARLHGRHPAPRPPLPSRPLRASRARPARLRALDRGRLGQHAAAHGAGVGRPRARLPRRRRRARPGAVPRAALRGPGRPTSATASRPSSTSSACRPRPTPASSCASPRTSARRAAPARS